MAGRYPSLLARHPGDEFVQEERRRKADMERYKRHEEHERLAASVGRRYRKARLDSFRFSDNPAHAALQRAVVAKLRDYAGCIEDSIREGRGIVLYGPPGTGKDHLLVAMLHLAIEAGFSVGWINGLDFYGDMRDGFDGDRSEASVMRSLGRPDVLGLSDPLPPWDKLTSFQASTMFRAIDRRYRDQKPVWTTINVANGAEAAERLGAAVVDRLRDGGLNLFCNWPSYRASE